MSKQLDHRSELDAWIEMWKEAETDGVHPKPKTSAPVPYDGDVEGDYYDCQELLQEEERTTPNPVYPDSVGPDCCDPKPVWVDEDFLKEIETLKNKLFDLENKLAKKMGGDGKWVETPHEPDDKKLMSEIEKMRDKIEKISSKLGIEHEPSPYKVKTSNEDK